MSDESELAAGLARVLQRAGLPEPERLSRLTGGATMESWLFSCGERQYVLRRAPSLSMMVDRPFGHAAEAAIIRAARASGVTAPEVVAELEPEDGIGSGFVMHALPGTPSPKEILAMDRPGRLLAEVAQDLARIHAIRPDELPTDVPEMDYREAVGDLRQQFDEAGGDRPIIALGLKWLADNLPGTIAPVLVHGDYRLGNILVDNSRLTGVLDWELAHFGDFHEDLAFGCMTVWRFARPDRPALGLGTLDDYFAAYEAESGRIVDRGRFRYWLVYRTVWWALGCLNMAKIWREGQDRMLERVVISRRTSEQELDLLMLLEEDAPEQECLRPLPQPEKRPDRSGEAGDGEIALAVSEWLAAIKDKVSGHDRFQLAVARNALGIIARAEDAMTANRDADWADLSREILAGSKSLATPELLATLRFHALEKLGADVPKYPALAAARHKWLGEN